MADSRQVIVTSTEAAFAQSIAAGPHHFVADEPVADGGGDAGPNPYDLLLAALGSCTSMTLRLYARRKKWPLERVEVRLTHTHGYGDDCVNCDDPARRISRIERQIALEGALLPDQRVRLLEIAEKCPVHKTLSGKLEIRTRLVEA
jgi:putative redox protein